jgi:hypothetical protein
MTRGGAVTGAPGSAEDPSRGNMAQHAPVAAHAAILVAAAPPSGEDGA